MKLDDNNHSVFMLHYYLIMCVKYRNKVIDSISISDYYLEATKQEAAYLTEQRIRFEANVLEEENNVIKISNSEKEKVEGMLEVFKRKNN